MRRCLQVLAVLLLSSMAAAEESKPTEAEASEPNWSISAGLDFSVLGLGLGLGSLSSNVNIPASGGGPTVVLVVPSLPNPSLAPTFVGEYRTGQKLWLLLRLSVSHLSSSNTNQISASLPDGSSSSTGGSLSLGLRNVFNNHKRVQLSGYALLLSSVSMSHSELQTAMGDGNMFKGDTLGLSVGVTTGLACDVFFTDNLALRVASSLLFVDYSQQKTTSTTVASGASQSTNVKSSSLDYGLRFSPSLEMRVLF